MSPPRQPRRHGDGLIFCFTSQPLPLLTPFAQALTPLGSLTEAPSPHQEAQFWLLRAPSLTQALHQALPLLLQSHFSPLAGASAGSVAVWPVAPGAESADAQWPPPAPGSGHAGP